MWDSFSLTPHLHSHLVFAYLLSWEKFPANGRRPSQVPQPTLRSGLGERMPPERIIFLQGLLEPSFWILAKYLHTFLGWAVCKDQFLFCQNLCKSIQKKARADLAPPQICHFSATKLSVQPSRKSNPAVGTNPVQHDCSQRNDKFVAEEKLSALGAFVPPTDFVSWRIWLGLALLRAI